MTVEQERVPDWLAGPAEDVTPLVGPLNAAQREAVTAPPEHRLVLAGAGSGKTRVLVHRVAWLLAVERVSPHSILAVTFTNKAAAEMRGRLEALIRVPVRALWVGTFHGIAHRLLRLHWKEAKLPQNFQILDADDQQRFIKRVMKGLGMSEEQWPPRTVVGFINGQKEEGRRPQDLGDSGDHSFRQLVRVYSAYQAACDAAGLVDFAELLLRAYELTRDVPEVQAHYRRRFRHLLVDEFQDTNTLQYQWLRVLAGDSGVLFAVGDDDQSIYSWRGARADNMMKLSRDFPGAQVVRLEQNYRSSGTILKAANALIAHNTGRLGKNLWTAGGEGTPIQVYAAFNDYDEAEFVVHRIREFHARGREWAEQAILYRTAAQSRVFEETLIRERIPYRIYGGLRFFERMEVKDALAYLRLIGNRADDPAFERVVNLPARGIGATTLDRLRELARAQGLSMWAAAKAAGSALGRAAGALHQFMELIEAFDRDTQNLPLSRAAEMVIERSGLKEHYRKERGEQAESRIENLDEVVNAARGFEEPQPAEEGITPLSAFLTHAALEAGERQAGAGEDCVQLMTLHSAKGLEFPVVYLAGLEQGMFPHSRAVEQGGLEEERRLCYVGMTRAREHLFLTHAEIRRMHGAEQIGAPSQFLRELPPALLVETRPRAAVLRPAPYASRPDFRSRSPFRAPVADDAAPGFRLGQRVKHPKFGEGTILSFDGDGERVQVEVRFREAGTKRLMLSFANLQACD
ncbi:MAG TPA: DNA helicase II [Candidatus Binatia bacterium]|nr:DNA helicase II [Candidatus Binatia bacterium]